MCELRTLYQFYDSLQDRGIGGTRTALPPHRDGFTPQQIDLGRYLFFDPMLSGDGTLSCASCHDPNRGLSDARPRSIGIHGADAGRAAPTIWNVAFLKRFFWDARVDSLEALAPGPLYSPREMGNTAPRLLASLNGNVTYRACSTRPSRATTAQSRSSRSTRRSPLSRPRSFLSTVVTTATSTGTTPHSPRERSKA